MNRQVTKNEEGIMNRQVTKNEEGIMNRQVAKIDFSLIFKNWKSPFVTRNQLFELTGGMINPKTMRNLDSLGEGINGKFNIGFRKVAYPVTEVVAWLEDRFNQVNKEHNHASNTQ